MWRPSSGWRRTRHAAMPEQCVNLGLAPAEGAERFRRGPAAANREHFVAKARAGIRVEHAVSVLAGIARFLKRAERVRREHFGPLVAVVARRIAAGADVAEA